MSLFRYISAGSNTTAKDGPGQVQGVLLGPGTGGTFYAFDSRSTGANFVPLLTTGKPIVSIPLPSAHTYFPLGGASFSEGLTVAAPSSTGSITVFYSG